MRKRALEYGERALDSGANDLLRVIGLEVDRRRGVLDRVNALDGLVEGAVLRGASARSEMRLPRLSHLGNVRDDDELEPVAIAREELLQVRDGRLPADGAADGEALLEEILHNPDGNVAIGSSDENFACGNRWH